MHTDPGQLFRSLFKRLVDGRIGVQTGRTRVHKLWGVVRWNRRHAVGVRRICNAGHDGHDLGYLLLQLLDFLILLQDMTCAQIQANTSISLSPANSTSKNRLTKRKEKYLVRSRAAFWHLLVLRRDPAWSWSRHSGCSPGAAFYPAWLRVPTWEPLCPSRSLCICAIPDKAQQKDETWVLSY